MKVGSATRKNRIRHFPLSAILAILAIVLFTRQIILAIFGANEFASMLFLAFYVLCLFVGVLNYFRGKFDLMKALSALTVLLIVTFFLFNGKLEALQGAFSIILSLLLISLTTSHSDAYNAAPAYRFFLLITSTSLAIEVLINLILGDGLILEYTGNGNQSALILFCYIINLYLLRFDKNGKPVRWLYDLLILILAVGCFLANSRAVILALALILLMRFVSKFSLRILHITSFAFLFVAFALPFLMSFFVTIIGKDATLFGQTIYTGREILWANGTIEILSNPFLIHIGENLPTDGMEYYGEGLNAHNVFLETAWRCSILVAILLFVMLYQLTKHIIKNHSIKTQRKILPAMCAILFHMMVESSLFIGALDHSALVILPMIIILSKEKSESNEA